MRARVWAALAIAAVPAAMASAQNLSNLITSLHATPSGFDAPEGVGFSEDFEGFTLGGAAQFGWTTNAGTIVNSGIAGFGARSAAVSGSPDGMVAGFLTSPDFGAASFGILAADIVVDIDDGTTTYGFQSADNTSGFINTRVLFQPGGGIDVVQVVGGMGAIVGTTGSWAAGMATQIGIEVLAGNMLNVYQDGALIFSGHDIVQELAAGPGGIDALGAQNFGVGNSGVIIIDNITDQLVPSPGALALFGVAGLAATRRRR